MKYIYEDFNRPATSILQRFRKIGTAVATDIMGRYMAMEPAIKGIRGGIVICGPALTVRTYRSDNLFLHGALELAIKGDILVVDAGGVLNAGIWGGLMNTMAEKKELGGIVIDGAVRDSVELQKSTVPVFSKSISPMGGFKEQIGSIGERISCGGVSVESGDLILGDDDGIAVIPKDQIMNVLDKAELLLKKEKIIREKIETGETLFSLLELDKKLQLVRRK